MNSNCIQIHTFPLLTANELLLLTIMRNFQVLILLIVIAISCTKTSMMAEAAAVAAATATATDSSSSSSSFRKAFVRGGVARCIGQATLYPVDALRTLAQTRDGKTLADVGTKALIRGCFTTSSFALGMGAIQFSVFNQLKEKYNIKRPIAAACSATASCIVSVPQEVIKQRLVTGVYPTFRNAVRSIWKQDGIKGFYSAWRPTS